MDSGIGRPRLAVLVPALLGAVAFCLIWPRNVLTPSHIEWLLHGDAAAGFLGWHFFRHEPWRWPIGLIADYPYPIGTSIVFTDSIPLLALLLKPFSTLLPAHFQYVGLWLMLCYVLQGVFAHLLLSRFTSHKSVAWAGTAVFLLSPVLAVRTYMHFALAGHWIILAALWLYFGRWQTRSVLGWCLLLAISALVHAYLMAMALCLWAAFLVKDDSRGTTASWRPKVLASAAILVLLAAVLWQTGYFALPQADIPSRGFGGFSMNLLAPVDPAGWSAVLPALPLWTQGQEEGFNYLGLSVMALLAFSALSAVILPDSGGLSRSWKVLLALCLALTIFSLSNKVTLGSRVLLEYPLPDALMQVAGAFRSSGRFFWPVFYVLTLLSVLGACRYLSPRAAAMALVAAAAVQAAELHRIPAEIGKRYIDAAPSPLVDPFWNRAAERYRHIALVPQRMQSPYYIPFALLAADKGLTLNVGYFARWDAERFERSAAALNQEISRGEFRRDTLYVLVDEEAAVPSATPVLNVDGFYLVAPGGTASSETRASAAWVKRSEARRTAQSLYLGFLHRPAEPAGLRFWTAEVSRSGGRSLEVAAKFSSAPEALAAARKEAGFPERVAESYAALSGRAPRPVELGRLSRLGNRPELRALVPWLVAADLLQSGDAVFLNRLELAQHYTDNVYPALGWRPDLWEKSIRLITGRPESVQQAIAALRN